MSPPFNDEWIGMVSFARARFDGRRPMRIIGIRKCDDCRMKRAPHASFAAHVPGDVIGAAVVSGCARRNRNDCCNMRNGRCRA
ncbi:hypothetical protein [Burkholderia dolosa]|uniref:hypothetical protein n=1 Tax=Burkholderia dolosa TaxID=152500 RepID=UPI0027D2D47D|nr:hypothetical protein [Burkholderia dolosa]